MPFTTENEAVTYIFRSLRKLRGIARGLDEDSRDVGATRRVLAHLGLLDARREYAVVTGSKGKGSTTVITAKLLQHLGHTVGMMTSPHLITWRERVRVNGRAIPTADFLRILGELEAEIDHIEATLSERQYFSPQGIFLALALRWFDEQGVTAAVLEVGRGGRFDDIAVAPNKLALFTPIMLEHTQYLGPTLERIAWHKAGIIKPLSYAYSLPQAPEVLDRLQTEAEAQGAEFSWLTRADLGEYLGPTADGMRVQMGRFGAVTLSLLGRYQIANATLAVTGAGNLHGRLAGVPHGSADYTERIRAGLADIVWPGRVQKLQDDPLVYLDGAINGESAQALVKSLDGSLEAPVASIIAVPDDKDYAGVYAALGALSERLILTETARNPILRFPDAATALAAARRHNANVSYAARLEDAVEAAKAGAASILIVGTQSILADATALWGYSYEVI